MNIGITYICANNKIFANVYSFLNSNQANYQHWNCWRNIWKLRVAPKIKTFIWLLIQGRVKTYEYLYNMRLSPPDCYVFCGLVLETSDHLFRLCGKSQIVWNLIKQHSGLSIILNDPITNGDWLVLNHRRNSHQSASLVATTIWHIWRRGVTLSLCKKFQISLKLQNLLWNIFRILSFITMIANWWIFLFKTGLRWVRCVSSRLLLGMEKSVRVGLVSVWLTIILLSFV